MILLEDYDGNVAKPIKDGWYLVLKLDDENEKFWDLVFYSSNKNQWDSRNVIIRWAELPKVEDYE